MPEFHDPAKLPYPRMIGQSAGLTKIFAVPSVDFIQVREDFPRPVFPICVHLRFKFPAFLCVLCVLCGQIRLCLFLFRVFCVFRGSKFPVRLGGFLFLVAASPRCALALDSSPYNHTLKAFSGKKHDIYASS
jgi:hypothetical protein